MRKAGGRNIILSLAVLAGFLAGFLAQSIVAAPPNPGHSWSQLECDSALCITQQSHLGIGTANPYNTKVQIAGDSITSSDYALIVGDYWQRDIMTARNDRKVGIQTRSPASAFHIRSEIDQPEVLAVGRARSDDGPLTSQVSLEANDVPNARIGSLAYRASGVDSFQRFYISVDSASATPWNDGDFVITPSGYVGIGTADPQNTLHVAGRIRVTDTQTSSSSDVLCVNSNSVIVKCGSSERYKENVRPLATEEAYRILLASPALYVEKDSGIETAGLLAEDLDDAGIRGLVKYESGQPDRVNYQGAVAYLLGVVKAQQERLDSLDARVAELEK